MDSLPLYQRIAESIRQQILCRQILPGESLPSVREMAERWQCTPGTVQRAYKELSDQGLLVSRPGQGTHVIGAVDREDETPLRRAALVHQAETFLLQVLTAGHSLAEVELAIGLALDRWRALDARVPVHPTHQLRFVGSHDPAVTLIAAQFAGLVPGCALQVTFAGSLGGLIALANGEADLAGSHLWDEQRDSYNEPFVRRLLPGRRVALLTLARRHLGLIVGPGNPLHLSGLIDLAQSGLRLANRQRGAGTRVWLDAQLRRLGVDAAQIAGYDQELPTHSQVARAVAEGQADAGLGIEAAALAYHLPFLPLTSERYDLVLLDETWALPPVQALAHWLSTADARAAIAAPGGYDTAETGQLLWVE